MTIFKHTDINADLNLWRGAHIIIDLGKSLSPLFWKIIDIFRIKKYIYLEKHWPFQNYITKNQRKIIDFSKSYISNQIFKIIDLFKIIHLISMTDTKVQCNFLRKSMLLKTQGVTKFLLRNNIHLFKLVLAVFLLRESAWLW